MGEQELPDFTTWLMKILPNDTNIGALARFVASREAWPKGNSRAVFLDYLEMHAGRDMVKAFVLAWGFINLRDAALLRQNREERNISNE